MIYDLKTEQPEKLENFKGSEKYLSAKIHDDGNSESITGKGLTVVSESQSFAISFLNQQT